MTDTLDILPARAPVATASLTLDLEYDYGGEATRAVRRFEDFVRFVTERGVPLTVFVEGRLLREQTGLADLLREPGIHPALHCLDHRSDGDGYDDIARGRDLFAERIGRHPLGYRAHTFRFSRALVRSLIDLGFAWDSSFLPARFGFGAGDDRDLRRVLRDRDAALLRDPAAGTTAGLAELPVGTLRGLRIPFIHSYQLLAGRPASALLHRTFGLPRLFVHDAHMVDLYRATASIDAGHIPGFAAWLYRLSWRGGQTDSLPLLDGFLQRVRADGRTWRGLADVAASLEVARG